MNYKEKAEELMHKHLNINLSQLSELVDGVRIRLAKENALITVNEIISMQEQVNIRFDFNIKYWLEVKKELEKL